MFGNSNAAFNMPVMPAYGNGGGFGGLGDDWLAIIILFAIFGWGGFGGGGFGGMGGGAAQNYVLASDFATIQRQLSDGFNSIDNALDAQNSGICNLGYTQLELANGVNMNIANNAAAVTNAITTNGYENRLGQLGITQQIADCCCGLKTQIGDVNYNMATQAAGLGRQVERGFADTNYAMATQNCATLQAIDKVGDRVIDYLANQEAQKLRDENFALRLAASQEAQNNALINKLQPCPIPAYITCNPNAPLNYNVTYGNGCGCA